MTRTLLRDGRVLIPDGWATALVVDGDRIDWVGASADTPAVDHVLDLRGRLVTPAFVDAHVHLAATGFAMLGADLSSVCSADEALGRLAEHAATSRLSVVLAHGWDDDRWTEPPSPRQLDAAVGGRPAYVSRVDMHSALASTALRDAAAGPTPLPDLDGWSERGPLSRDAHHAVRDAMNALLTIDDRRQAIRRALRAAAALGIGVVHEIGAPHISPSSDFDLIDELVAAARAEGRPLPRVERYWGSLDVDEAQRLGCLGAAGDLCVDGAVGSRTAALHEAYDDAPTSGHLYLTAEQVADHVVACTEQRLQAGFHVIGDRGVSEVVAGFRMAAERVGDEAVRVCRHRLEHLEMVTPEQVHELARLGVVASVQPVFDAWWGGPDGLYETRLGGRAKGMNPFATMRRAGMTVAFGSDSPVTPMAPWDAVRAAEHHHDPSEQIDAGAALEAHTVAGWEAAGVTAGTLASDASAYVAVWGEVPQCDLMLVAGLPAHDVHGEWPTGER